MGGITVKSASTEQPTLTTAEQKEQLYQLITEKSGDGIAILREGTFVYVNRELSRLTGYSENELLGFSSPQLLDIVHPHDSQKVKDEYYRIIDFQQESVPSTRHIQFHFRAFMKTGVLNHYEIIATPITYQNKPAVLMLFRDITIRKEIEQQLDRALEERELMIREIHHRIKNNLALISSMINLQKEFANHNETTNVLSELMKKIEAISQVHSRLYNTNKFTEIELSEYLEEITRTVLTLDDYEARSINLILELDTYNTTMETAIPLGLIVTEIMTNSLKYAFPDQPRGTIRVESKVDNDTMQLTLADDGIGLPHDIDLGKSRTLGMLLIRSLIEQLKAELTIDTDTGTAFTIRVPHPDKER